ncbi:MAG: hypothetical protein IKK21_10430 [Clostridia bacterium]|nr:hypothetical protein [Clostridia bacterium]
MYLYLAFPKDLRDDLAKATAIIPDVHSASTAGSITYKLENHAVIIPYRLYVPDVADDCYEKLDPVQKQMLCCLYTRNHDGFLREKYLRRLLSMPLAEWAYPYVVKLCDEYVVEILQTIYDGLKERDNAGLQAFCLRNKPLLQRSYNQMVSYWNEFYRSHTPHFRSYIGRKLFRDCLGYDRTFERD